MIINKDILNSGTKYIKRIVKDNTNPLYENLRFDINNALDSIGDLINLIVNNNYIDVKDKAHKLLNNLFILKQNVDNIYNEQFPDDLKKIYNQFKTNYEKYQLLISECDYKFLNEELKTMQQKFEDATENVENKIKEIDNLSKKQQKESKILSDKFEGIGATVINIILSISIISAAVVAIEKFDKPIHITMFITVITWLLMTCICFNQAIFKNKDDYPKGIIVIYVVLSLLTVIIIFLSLLYNK